MAVKSSTKKRLMELGIKEELAHKLADDANMDTVKKMSVQDVATKLGLKTGDNDLETVMSVIREQSASSRSRAVRRMEMQSKDKTLETSIPMGDTRFNVLNHELTPHHELVSEDNEADELSPWNLMTTNNGVDRLRKELLPKILITDPAIQALKEAAEQEDPELRAGWLNNRVVKVIRRSPSAGVHVAYRLVVEGN